MGWQRQVGGGGGGGLVPAAAVVYGSELGISSVDEPKNRVRKDIRMSMGIKSPGVSLASVFAGFTQACAVSLN